jgi:cbb3-type cytochrome c oxidase subunit III
VTDVGGDDGPDLTHEGQKDPGRLDFSEVPGEETIENWQKEHFRDPARVVAGSGMPLLGLQEDEIELLTFYMMSLRKSNLPEAYWPEDRIRAERLGEREFATDGATLYGAFCAACHGQRGEGMRYPRMSPFPSIGNPDFLAIAPEGLLLETVRRGRPGRRMPAWGDKEGGLRPAEIDAVVAHVRSLGGVPPERDERPARWVKADAGAGARLYAANCAVCHGNDGEGGEGPALNNLVLLEFATDTYLVETVRRGRRATSMPGFGQPAITHRQLSVAEIEAVVTFLRTWEVNR